MTFWNIWNVNFIRLFNLFTDTSAETGVYSKQEGSEDSAFENKSISILKVDFRQLSVGQQNTPP